MIYNNNATRHNKEILIRLCELFFASRLADQIDRLPLELRPRDGQATRCCVYRDRAIIKYRCMAALGFAVEDEQDELTPLSEYAEQAMNRQPGEHNGKLLTVVDEACAGCIHSQYYVTNACQGCLARPCMMNCPKKAIEMRNGQAVIDPDKCVNCGKCMQVCPYHAIVYIPIPCEEACPVGAIMRGDNGKQVIDEDKCIHCGRCMQACPFAAILENRQIAEVLGVLTGEQKSVAMIAPALAGQFKVDFKQIVGAMHALGFDAVMEVATGAEQTAREEASEFEERMSEGHQWMASSCCPAWTETAQKHLPDLLPAVSTTPTPMHFTAERAKNDLPGSVRVFVSPCLAKRREALADPAVDFVVTFEEIGAMLVAKGIDVADCTPAEPIAPAGSVGRKFPSTGGVSEAVRGFLDHPDSIHAEQINGLDRKTIRKLKAFDRIRGETNFLEVMSCEGGCLGGPCTICHPPVALRQLHKLTDKD